MVLRTRAAGLLAGMGGDLLFADPRRGHPVAAFGRVAAALEKRTYSGSRAAGALHTGGLVAGVAAAGALVERAGRASAGRAVALTALATWAVVGGRSLGREALGVQEALRAGDLPRARRLLPALCGRDPAALDEKGIARAVVESVAENTADAVVAPLFWGAVAGVPGLLGYRAINTLDAMIGHRSERYLRFGWAAARLDDAANWVPSRVTGLLACACARAAGGRTADAWRVLRRDGASHPSPNAGRCESAFAGALGVRLGGVNRYGSRVEHRPEMGDGPAPGADDIPRAVRLAAAVGVTAALLAAGLSAAAKR